MAQAKEEGRGRKEDDDAAYFFPPPSSFIPRAESG
jgi:hypothetical protein